jgi:antitoxin StbD
MNNPLWRPVAVLNHNHPAAHPLPHTTYQQRAAEIRESIGVSRNDPRPAIPAETLFAELDVLIDEVEAERNRR